MKTMRRILASILLTVTVFSLSVTTVFAEEDAAPTIKRLDEEYTYTLTIYEGAKGSFKESVDIKINGDMFEFTPQNGKIVIDNLNGTETVEFDSSIVNPGVEEKTTHNGSEIGGEQYYVKGFNESGRDNSKALTTVNVNVGEVGSVDYVVSYGISDKQVKYIVRHLDRKTGLPIISDETFFGNEGDKPIVMSRYIDGYAPDVKAYTKTLVAIEDTYVDENGKEVNPNIFEFYYDKVPTQTVKENVTEKTEYSYVTVGGETIYIDGGVTGTTTGGVATNVTGGGAGTNGADGADEDADAQTGAAGETGIPGLDESEIVDLDDEEVPLANIEAESEETGSSTGVYAAIGILALIIAAVAAYIVSKKRKVQE